MFTNTTLRYFKRNLNPQGEYEICHAYNHIKYELGFMHFSSEVLCVNNSRRWVTGYHHLLLDLVPLLLCELLLYYSTLLLPLCTAILSSKTSWRATQLSRVKVQNIRRQFSFVLLSHEYCSKEKKKKSILSFGRNNNFLGCPEPEHVRGLL